MKFLGRLKEQSSALFDFKNLNCWNEQMSVCDNCRFEMTINSTCLSLLMYVKFNATRELIII